MTELQFPKGFYFGTATAAYQIEGGWDADEKGPSTWDIFVRKPGKIKDGHTGDVACNTYRDPQTDVDLMASLKMNAYRFSVAWSRVIPNGKGEINQKGLDYYDKLVDALLEKNITPFITLFHWDMPYALFQENKGFAGRDTAYYFADYSEVVVKKLGDRVKHWITLNEPWEHAMMGHFLGEHAPGIKNPKTYFRVAHHELLGHGLAVQRLRGLYDDLQIGITLSQFPVYPYRENPGPKDWEAAEFADLFMNRFFLDGVFKHGYPEKLLKRIGPLRPPIQPGDGDISTQPIDFLGVNYYSRVFADPRWYIPFLRVWVERNTPEHLMDPELGAHAYPQGMQELCKRYREEYGNPTIYITENGTGRDAPVVDGQVHDEYRIQYLTHYLSALRKAIDEGSDVKGYFYWTLIDNFEWNGGFTHRMGLIHVNHDTQERIIKDSGYWMRDLIESQTN